MKKIMAVMALSAFSMFAYSGQINDAKVGRIAIYKDGSVAIELIGGTLATAQPSCATSVYKWVSGGSAVGTQRILATATAAKLGNANVSITGTGACAVSGQTNREEISYFIIN